ncbi:hypothetical protein AGMMS4952_02810 [Spirochaetia bacterium]|nr:hypothetical protein AGMMS4952_02810 [Spirochaetia bacterium]
MWGEDGWDIRREVEVMGGGGGGGLLALLLVLALAACPTDSSDDSPNNNNNPPVVVPDLTVANVTELSKIAAFEGSGSAVDPLLVKFTSAFTGAEFANLSKDITGVTGPYGTSGATVTITAIDPLGKLFDAIGEKYVALDLSDAVWTGLDDPTDIDTAYMFELNGGEDVVVHGTAVYAAVRGAGYGHVVSIRFPKNLKTVGLNLFAYSPELKKVDFTGCSALESIGANAFLGSAKLEDATFTGCSALAYFDSGAFERTNLRGSNGTDVLDLSDISVDKSLEVKAAFTNISGGVRQVTFPKRANSVGLQQGSFQIFGPELNTVSFVSDRPYLSQWAFDTFLYYDNPWPNRTGSSGGGYNNVNIPKYPVVAMLEGWNGGIQEKNARVMEIHVPESISWVRTYWGGEMLYNKEDDGYSFGSMFIPMKNGQDVYRGQATMQIAADVPTPPAGTVDVYSQKTATAQYKIGTMAGGKVTLTAPASGGLEDLTNEAGMKITGDPTEYHTAKNGDYVDTASATGVWNNPADDWNIPANFQNTGNPALSGKLWFPYYGKQSGALTGTPKFLAVSSMYYQDGAVWKEIKRTGGDTYSVEEHVTDGYYYYDTHDIMYVYVSEDLTIKRAGRYGTTNEQTNGGTRLGYQQALYENTHSDSKAEGKAFGVNFSPVNLSLKAGWNQVETTTRVAGEDVDNGWDCIRKILRVSAGIQGPKSTYAGPTGDFYSWDGLSGTDRVNVVRRYSQEGNQIQVPWVVK